MRIDREAIGKKLYVFDKEGNLEYMPKKITDINPQGLPIMEDTYSQIIKKDSHVFLKK